MRRQSPVAILKTVLNQSCFLMPFYGERIIVHICRQCPFEAWLPMFEHANMVEHADV